MNLFNALLRANMPLIFLIEPDLAWARMYVLEEVAAIGADDRILEYTAAGGWSGPERIMDASSLPKVTTLRSSTPDTITFVGELGAWLKGMANRTAFSMADSPMFQGVVVLHDLYKEIDSPVLVRQLIDLTSLLSEHAASAVVILPNALHPAHPLHGAGVQVPPHARDTGKHNTLVRAFLDQLGPLADNVDPVALARLLDRETLARAEAILRLAMLQLTEQNQGGAGEQDLQVLVKNLRAALE